MVDFLRNVESFSDFLALFVLHQLQHCFPTVELQYVDSDSTDSIVILLHVIL